jgi:hypothetical protein
LVVEDLEQFGKGYGSVNEEAKLTVSLYFLP